MSRTRRSARAHGTEPFWVTRRGARIALVAAHAAAFAAVLVEFILPLSAAGAHGTERVHALEFTASFAVYGFVSCVLLVLLGILLRRLVKRDEDYYRDGAR